MDRDEVYNMLDNENILVERLKRANSQRKLKKGNQQKHKRTKQIKTTEAGRGDSVGLSPQEQADEETA